MRKPDLEPQILRAILQRAFPREREIPFERMRSGGSTQVYRIDRDSGVCYLRFGEDPQDTFAPEARVHDLLESLGARVPHVVLFEDVAREIERSIMVTTEIKGSALQIGGSGFDGIDSVNHSFTTLQAAAVDLARVNSIRVSGYGFIDRTRPWNGKLTGRYLVFADWSAETFDVASSTLGFFNESESNVVDECRSRVLRFDHGSDAYLVHGDFDTSHIFADERGYTGLIDFGEIRGADRWYDLADFLVHTGGDASHDSFLALLDGYRSVTPVDDWQLGEIETRAVTLGISLLRRIRGRALVDYEALMVRAIRTLLGSERLRSAIA